MENKVECNKCKEEFGSEGALTQHTNAKHSSFMEAKKITQKSVLKYGLGIMVIALIVGIGVSNRPPSHDNLSQNSKAEISPSAISQESRTASLSAQVGAKAVDFTLPSSTGQKISLSDYRGKNVLLYFQEGVMCDPCWKQTFDIQNEYDKFQSMGIELLTITVDPLNAVIKNAKRFGITLPVLTDEDLKVSKTYDVLKNSMHPGERPGHTFILLDKEGDIIWKKEYFLASGSTIMTMDMGGKPMTMDMGMDMGTPDSVMYVPVYKLLEDLKSANLESSSTSSSVSTSGTNMSNQNMSMEDHTMCLTPIHNHVDFKMYLGGSMLNFSQNNYMDQSNIIHFHKTVKVRSDDIPGIPNGVIIHIHKENLTVSDFLKTLDLPFNIDGMQLKVYANGVMQSAGLNYVLKDKDRLLVTDSTNETQIKSQMDSVTDYAIQGKEKNPSLFGGC